MFEELQENYIPKKLLFRENQIAQIETVFQHWKEYKSADNLILCGTTGAGKTVIIQKIIQEHQNTMYISCKDHNSARKVFLNLTGLKNGMTCDLMRKFAEQLKSKPKIVIIDEIHKVKDFSNLMDFINEIYRKTNNPFMIISNQRNLIFKMSEDARLTLFFQKIDFGSYDALQLGEIIQERLGLLKEKNIKMPEDIKNYICAKVVNEHFGSARIALDLVLKCFRNKKFSQQFVNKIIYHMGKEETYRFVDQLNEQEKNFLNVLLELSKVKKEITSLDLKNEIQGISTARISQLITTFVKDYAILNESYHNMGRKGGRYRAVWFISEEDKANCYEALHPELIENPEEEVNTICKREEE
jgi:Cdc6-like AAA superfamily ATPase